MTTSPGASVAEQIAEAKVDTLDRVLDLIAFKVKFQHDAISNHRVFPGDDGAVLVEQGLKRRRREDKIEALLDLWETLGGTWAEPDSIEIEQAAQRHRDRDRKDDAR